MVEKQVLSGPIGSGKTTCLKKKYQQLITGGIKSDNILVMVRSSLDEDKWRRTIKLPASGTLHIHTYFGFVQNQLAKFWPLVAEKLENGRKHVQPVFMTVEAAHYLMGVMVEEKRNAGCFAEVKSTSENIAIQLIDNLNQAAVNGIPLSTAVKRLHKLAESGSREKLPAYMDAAAVMQQFREHCRRNASIDYSLAVELFNGILMKEPLFLEYLKNQWQYLIVDDIEEMVPTAQDLFLYLLDNVNGAWIGFDPQGGHTTFFGAYPEGVKEKILPLCRVRELKVPSSKHKELADNLAEFICGETTEIKQSPALKGQIAAELRGEMLNKVVNEIVKIVTAGVEPRQVAVIAPVIDKVLEFTLVKELEKHNIKAACLSRSKRILDQPFANAMVTLAVLVNDDWKMDINFTSLVQSLCLLLQLDPVRAAVLAEEIYRSNLALPDLDELDLREKVGYHNSERYQALKQWLEKQRQDKSDLELLFQKAFAELLSPLLPGEEDLLACRQLIDSAVKLRKVLNCYGEEMLGYKFIEMIQKGTLAAEVLYRPPADENKVILTSPLNFILNPYIEKVEYQFWLDIGSGSWMRGLAKELANPWVLSRRWSGSRVWDDVIDQETRVNKLSRLVRALLGKCSKGIFTAHSHLSSQGFEQNGLLVEAFDSVQQGGITGD
ncbi:MAG: hypothetical protein H0Z40_07635 [Desulfotomaculum sp.]|nr:hypothetical protein [Desulfotomaculum sp.]